MGILYLQHFSIQTNDIWSTRWTHGVSGHCVGQHSIRWFPIAIRTKSKIFSMIQYPYGSVGSCNDYLFCLISCLTLLLCFALGKINFSLLNCFPLNIGALEHTNSFAGKLLHLIFAWVTLAYTYVFIYILIWVHCELSIYLNLFYFFGKPILHDLL